MLCTPFCIKRGNFFQSGGKNQDNNTIVKCIGNDLDDIQSKTRSFTSYKVEEPFGR